MSQSSDLDVLKDIPGYKAILKSVLKSQIQLLIEQLADHTGEESIILTASINDGTLSHLGSSTGKGFLEGRDDMKSQFLGYCLKTHHKKNTSETKSPAYQRSNQRHMPYRTPPKRDRIHPVSIQRAQVADDSGSGLIDPSDPQLATNQSGSDYVKLERHETDTSTSTFPSSLQLSHTQTSGDLEKIDQGNSAGEGQTGVGESGVQESNGASESSATDIKIEPITENEMELEITGVEPGNVSLGPDDWAQGQAAGYATPTDGDSSLNQSADASNYSLRTNPNYQSVYGDVSNLLTQRNYLSLDGNEDCGEKKLGLPQHQISAGIKRTDVNSETSFEKKMPEIPLSDLNLKHKCQHCGKMFLFASLLKRHISTHTGVKEFFCEKCGKGFTRAYRYKQHLMFTHGEHD